MARKREVQLRIPIDKQEDWNNMLSKPGLYVVDVYQEWCQPCVAIESILRKVKNELGDDLLHFAVAKADTIDSLIHYRGRCKPCFLFYAGGTLVAQYRGIDAPLLSKMIVEELQKEHRVIKGEIAREEIKDPNIKTIKTEEKMSVKPGTANKIVAVAIIKPDVVKQGKVDEIIKIIESSGIEIIKREDRQLTENEARELYKHIEGEEYFDDIIDYICSGISCILAISKSSEYATLIKEMREITGPKDVEEAKKIAPNSLRANYGKSKLINAIHASSDESEASRELAFLFPDLQTDLSCIHGGNQTLALIRPDGVKNFKENILADIQERGFKIVSSKEITLSMEKAEEFYSAQKGTDHYDTLIQRMISGPSLILILEKENSVSEWRHLLGPTCDADVSSPDSLRGKFKIPDIPINLIHGSSTVDEANKEIDYFFPIQKSVMMISGNEDEILRTLKENGYKINDTIKFKVSDNPLTTFFDGDSVFFNKMNGKTVTCILVDKMDTIHDLQNLVGPEDIEEAKNNAPNSLRALYGTKDSFGGIFYSINESQVEEYINKLPEFKQVMQEAKSEHENEQQHSNEEENLDEHENVANDQQDSNQTLNDQEKSNPHESPDLQENSNEQEKSTEGHDDEPQVNAEIKNDNNFGNVETENADKVDNADSSDKNPEEITQQNNE